ncbi:LPS biosynthesis-modulating metalloenzyme YejM [Rouxiella badensis]|jgi:membrane-anchored protein YejM (alkaline phosphatase superfamily)|uniref:Inner membrane protein YejM n=1 Tax=Rouxiella badensis TaxID=1646377 RepID=A0A1X0WHI7_9GAMM|nr:LPS biosynthesis-modulating metalloenzyme YejM [Rouxiella badensis]MCC3720635.1 LPS biosynthesis-modulating metalloenzyme YejM [Rouxiella badensis]MCC3730495.1 LPS biosynthesis-modulating metalloenzyme YejM [Rouxiella badensis]MCC3735535.1 LPS biosynthesis-modulating metalloenzyme YejM [Rouxiella badensis]MCC3741771.1 LPS biosynthesis-modulating metalloenzyme YejM [Rouxiella badensis]MCC3747793.1 LPS biosynthesis-modulating metalloenzyme YejM [Rouxiella badensis]
MVTNSPRYREKVSQMVSWGHWFALFNILLSLGLGSRYLFVSDWPSSLEGRIYALVSWLGHFSFVGFSVYLLIIFPLTFVVMSQRLLRFLSAILATTGLTLLLVDTEVFTRFHLHINPVVWELVVNPGQAELARDWQLMFICVPVIFLVEMLFGTWAWQKLRSLNRRSFAKPLVVLFICCFFASHLMYIWADANFYRPITMQRSNLPLSYPMTARKFLEKHGLLDAQAYQQRLIEQGDPEAISVEYPLNNISFRDKGSNYNLLMIVVNGLNANTTAKYMPELNRFASQNVNFTHHFSSGSQDDTGLFGLFYGISPTYLEGIITSRKPSALMNALTQQNYEFGLFASDNFNSPLYRQALLSDFSLPAAVRQTDPQTTQQWQQWLATRGARPWFSYVSFNGTSDANLPNKEGKQPTVATINRRYQQGAAEVDGQIAEVLKSLQDKGVLDKTVVVITGSRGVDLTSQQNQMDAEQIQVPLVIHWPNTPAQTVSKLTAHEDVMTTLMQRLLHVSTSPSDYSQGEDLFAARRNNNWVSSTSDGALVITTPTQTIRLDNNGNYRAYDSQGNELKDQKPELGLLLQVLTDQKRFVAN